MKMKSIGIILSLLVLMLLSACGDSEAENEVDEEVTTTSSGADETIDQSSSIENSSISTEFSDELNRFVEGVREYSNKDKFYMDRYKSLAPTTNKEGTLEKYKVFLDDFDVYLESYYFTPENDVEGELTKHMSNYIMHMKSRNSYQKDFTQTQDSLYNKLAVEEANEAILAIESFFNAMIKHGIIVE